MRTRVKICGITRIEDARLAADLGAAALGFILCPSVRRVSITDARRIVAQLPPYLDRVGVFVDASAREIVRAVETLGLSRVQLHGNESAELAAEIPCAITRTLSWNEPNLEQEIARWRAIRGDVHFLIDLPKEGRDSARPPAAATRTSAIDDDAVANLCRQLPLTLAGGLDDVSVTTILERFRPTAVDVARGVEAQPGVKDERKVRAFFRAVAAFDAVRGSAAGGMSP